MFSPSFRQVGGRKLLTVVRTSQLTSILESLPVQQVSSSTGEEKSLALSSPTLHRTWMLGERLASGSLKAANLLARHVTQANMLKRS